MEYDDVLLNQPVVFDNVSDLDAVVHCKAPRFGLILFFSF